MISEIKIQNKQSINIGARMGRPEKALSRKMRPAVHVLFPVSRAGGPQRNLMEAEKIVVTRHMAMVAYLIKMGYVDKDVKRISYAQEEDIKDKHVFGILPNWLACHTERFTEVQLICSLSVQLRFIKIDRSKRS